MFITYLYVVIFSKSNVEKVTANDSYKQKTK